jgi:NAD(P)-dependent dehydrogenase (short-subunit alcohol dehydrogenase family)
MRAVLVTGGSGGIGEALCAGFHSAGWRVIASDFRRPKPSSADAFIDTDLETLATDDAALAAFKAHVNTALEGAKLAALVNNAAVQLLASTQSVSAADWERTMRINLSAPFRLVQAFLGDLETASGVVINIGSVHAQATKPEFVSYATSKAAIHGLTRALAVDLGPRLRVVCIAPAAVATPMLLAGFADNAEAMADLAKMHPAGRLAQPAEIAEAAVAIADKPFLFSTGSTFWLDGGILSRLHDPL